MHPLPACLPGLPGLQVGVEDAHLQGRVRMTLRPLLKRVPVVGAIQVGAARLRCNIEL